MYCKHIVYIFEDRVQKLDSVQKYSDWVLGWSRVESRFDGVDGLAEKVVMGFYKICKQTLIDFFLFLSTASKLLNVMLQHADKKKIRKII